MDENVVETLRIEVVGDSSNAVGGLERLISTLERIKGVTSGSNKGLNGVQKHLQKISEAADKINSGSISKIYKIANGLKALNAAGNIKISSKVADRILDLGAAIDCLKDVDMSKLTEMASGLSALRNVGNVSIPRLTGGGANSVSSTPSSSPLDGEVHIDPSTVTDTTERLEELGNTLGATGSRFETFKAVATKALSGVKSAASITGKVVKTMFGGIAKKLRDLGRMFAKRVVYRAMNAVISAVTTALRDGVNAVYQYSKAMDGQLAKSLDSLATSFNYLKGSLGAMVAPLINMLAPAIEWLIEKFVDLLNIVNQVFARLSGASTWTKATKVATEYAAAAESATAANQKLKKSLLGMDEINALQDNSSSGGSGAGGSDASAYAFEEVPLDTAYVDGIIDKLKDILWYVGAVALGIKAWDFGKAIASLAGLKGLNALSFAAGLTLTVASLTIMVKGLVDIISDGINWKNFAETLGGGGGVIAGGALIGKAFGSAALGAAIAAIVVGIPMYIVGIWDAIKEGLNWINGLLIPAGATLAGTGIGAIVGAAVGSIGGPLGAGIGALIGLAVGALTDLVILIVQNWDVIVDWCSQALADIGQFFVNLWDGICEVWSVVADWFDTYVIQPVANFFVGLWEGISSAASACWNAIVEFFSPAVEWFGELFGSIWQTVSDIFYNIGVIASGCWEIIKRVWEIVSTWFNENVIQPVATFFSNLWTSVKNWAIGAWNSIKSVFSTIGNWIYDKVISPVATFFSNLWKGFVEKAKAAWEGVKSVFSKVAEFFGNIFRDAWAKVVKVFSIAGEIFVDIKNAVVEAFKKVVNGIITGLNKVISIPFNGINSALQWLKNIDILGLQPFSGLKTINVPQIPLLAEGGIVNAGQLFIAREAGAELVGNIGRQTAVMNNDQIVESVAQGVADANAEQNALLREEISILRKLLEKDTNVTAYVGTGSLISGLEKKNRRDGKTIVPVGV